jgi:hypothetical protein
MDTQIQKQKWIHTQILFTIDAALTIYMIVYMDVNVHIDMKTCIDIRMDKLLNICICICTMILLFLHHLNIFYTFSDKVPPMRSMCIVTT